MLLHDILQLGVLNHVLDGRGAGLARLVLGLWNRAAQARAESAALLAEERRAFEAELRSCEQKSQLLAEVRHTGNEPTRSYQARLHM